jgi:hypothetical protein
MHASVTFSSKKECGGSVWRLMTTVTAVTGVIFGPMRLRVEQGA